VTDLLARHLSVKQYGRFTLTEAVRPSLDVPIRPRQGYKIEVYRDRRHNIRMPMLCAAVSAEKLFDVFLDLLKPLGETAHVVLESSHGDDDFRSGHIDRERRHVDTPVLASHFCDYEDLLLNDGCTGVAVLAGRRPMEVQFDEHKQFTIYAANVRPFQRILKAHGIKQRPTLKLLSEAEHLHHTSDDYADQFEQLAMRLGVENSDPVFADDE